MNKKRIEEIPGIITELYSLVSRLEKLFPDRRFTPDGHLVGSIGEVLATHRYSLKLFPSSYQDHDAKTEDGRLVQIKATQVKSIGLYSRPDNLLVIKIQPDGSYQEIFNGPGNIAWEAAGKMQKNGQRSISLSKLLKLMDGIPYNKRLPKSVT